MQRPQCYIQIQEKKMWKYLLKRIGISVVILVIVSIVIFVLIRMQPGNPFVGMVSADTDPDYIEKRMEELGYNAPLPEQYVKWLGRTLKLDLGYSLQYKLPVAELILGRMKNTLLLSGTAFVLSSFIAAAAGVYTAYKRKSIFDHVITLISFVMVSVPTFFSALLLIKILSFDLGLLPPSGIVTSGSSYVGLERIKDTLVHMVLPVGILTIVQSASMMRYIRASMSDIFTQDYMRMAKAKGMKAGRLIWVHGFRNAWTAVITLFAMQFPSLLSGAVLTETVFVWPGIGRLNYDAILSQDYPVIMGVTIFMAVIIVGMNLLADVLCAVANPRISVFRKEAGTV